MHTTNVRHKARWKNEKYAQKSSCRRSHNFSHKSEFLIHFQIFISDKWGKNESLITLLISKKPILKKVFCYAKNTCAKFLSWKHKPSASKLQLAHFSKLQTTFIPALNFFSVKNKLFKWSFYCRFLRQWPVTLQIFRVFFPMILEFQKMFLYL